MTIEFSIIESTIYNSCFLILFITTIYYWGKIIFFSGPSALVEDLGAGEELKNSTFPINFGFGGVTFTTLLLGVQLIVRWIESGHFPLSGLYESLLFLSWGILFFYLFVEYKTQTELLGVVIAPVVLCILGFTGFSLPLELQQNKPLVPALQSNWLFMHVSVMMFSYAALLLGCLVSISYLILFAVANSTNSITRRFTFLEKYVQKVAIKPSIAAFFSPIKPIRSINQIETLTNKSTISLNTNSFSTTANLENSTDSVVTQESSKTLYTNFLSIFDNLSYRLIGIGFCFLTLGILSGAVWANETWGSYWSWDPKETWALITWLTFAIYLHTRLLQGWNGLKPASIASFGFVIIWVCYLGVNLLGKGLHSYGFFAS